MLGNYQVWLLEWVAYLEAANKQLGDFKVMLYAFVDYRVISVAPKWNKKGSSQSILGELKRPDLSLSSYIGPAWSSVIK